MLKIFQKFCESDVEFRESFAKSLEISQYFAKINNFIFAKFREIQNNFVKISWFAKFLKWCLAATLPKMLNAKCKTKSSNR